MDFRTTAKQFSDPRWRLNNLYYIADKEGRRVQFKTNWAQEELLDRMHYLNVVLKARQLGFTTLLQLFMLDACLFHPNIRAGTIAHKLEDAKTIFRDKVRFPYENLPDALKQQRQLVSDNMEELVLSNNSSIRVGTSLRSGTLQYLHISEYGKLCAQFPDKAREVRTGALNTVQAGQIAFIESTAEGQEGHFYDICQSAQTMQRTGAKHSKLDFKFHFFPWHRNPEYELDPDGVVITDEARRYFEKLETTAGISLSPAKQAWYQKKLQTQLGDMRREYPSTAEEAFEAALEGAYYSDAMAAAELQGRIGDHKAIDGIPVHTAWDLGVGDATSIWFFQVINNKVGLVGYYENSGEGMPHYVGKLKEYQARKGWTYGSHYVPHDARVKEWGSGRTRVEQMQDAGIRPSVIIRSSLEDGINAVRATIPHCWFDEAECAQGIKALKSYRKEWDDARGVWKDKPRHDSASHGADAFRYLAVEWRQVVNEPPEKTLQEKIAELIRPRTIAEVVAEYEQEMEMEEVD